MVGFVTVMYRRGAAGARRVSWPAYSFPIFRPMPGSAGRVGVVFVAAGSWVIPKIGAVNTAVLIIGGQMIAERGDGRDGGGVE